ncbi:glycosyltransferase [Pantoea sp. LMR881]|uniref:glycosyltransferase n=1 Tax=Pantoea sp. LMR881 TaxID=3014336 RepID=UPI0022B07DAF|nr:glycosyltransferase [Pantoea sp. LMR881]MCZ4058409.1 glycosyltransferase [Pantoea sp. LMR881]
MTRHKWLATFETELPRVLPVAGVAKRDNPELNRLIPAVLKDNCFGLIAISDATLNIQMKLFEHTPDIAKRMRAKTVVLHPPQTLYCQQKMPRQPGKLRLVFAGNEFYRKGGAEVVLAITELLDEKIIDESQIDVHLIGDLGKRHNIAHRQYQDNEDFYRGIENRIARYRCFKHKTRMDNEALMALFRQSDLGLLPTWQETYGFSVLEMQSNGCPVITSNVRALPEINPLSAGWCIGGALNGDREYSVTSVGDKDRLRSITIDSLKKLLTQIVDDPDQLHSKSEAAIDRIRQQHCPERYISKLNDIYRRGVTEFRLHPPMISI